MKIKKSDTVLVTHGKDRGRTGKVLRVVPQEERIMVEGINIRTKHIRAKRAGQKGQRIQSPVLIPAANVMLICPKCSMPARAGYRILGKKHIRICKKCGADIA